MTTVYPHPHSVPPLTTGLRMSALGRRISVSEPLAIVFSDLVYGTRERDTAELLHQATRARVADAVGFR